jgi:hypothetical protein
MRTVSKPTKNKPTPVNKTVEPDAPTHAMIPEDSYALMFHADNKVEIVAPQGAEFSNGHLLMLGILNLIKTPNWVDELIDETATALKEPYDE